jgi:ABC-type molybdate transport system substrate-binding protein
MKAGGKPDAYFACDTSFMTQVQDRFGPSENLSQTEIVMIVKKGNPLNIKTLDDLVKPGIKIGVGHPEQSALGALTKKLLDSKKLYEKIKPNISSETPSADMIVTQFKTGSLDVCLVYTVNINYMKNEIEIISLNEEKAIAVQPFAIANYTSNHYLTERFLEAIKNNNANFLKAGFKYLPNIVTKKKEN